MPRGPRRYVGQRSRYRAERRRLRLNTPSPEGVPAPAETPYDPTAQPEPEVHFFGSVPPELEAAFAEAATRLEASRANAPAEARKPSGECNGCHKTMPASERCEMCVENGAWYCAACHARFEGMA